ncbi:ATP-binding cassette domain-containing protein [Candidatus Peregrinibacteria bacterium]|nr:ATP-binding cassette domain-containing protein [Candidatus Peregrinibacteria bacterium]
MLGFELLLFYFSAKWWREGTFTVGDFVFFQIYLLGLFEGLWQFGRQIQMLFENMARASEMVEIFENPVPIQDAPDAKKLVVAKGEIEFQNLSFSYQNDDFSVIARSKSASDEAISLRTLSLRARMEPCGMRLILSGDEAISLRVQQEHAVTLSSANDIRIFRHFSLKIFGGQKVALVGPSGAGKSTIVKLLFRFFDADSGRICIDGQNIAKATQESLRRNIALVPQNPELFHRTISENITFGKPHASREEIRDAAKKAHADEFIEKLPRKYETLVGERGVKLSGGEKQRIAIARAFLENAPILVLDEATSSLDSLTERKIQSALEHLMKGRTTIVIAHRLSTIRKMDRIVVIQDGAIAEDGSHSELLEKNGLYSTLWKHQTGGFLE